MSIKELPPQGLLGLIELSQRKFDEVESLAKLNHSLTKEIERWERAYVELWAGALLKAKPEHQKIWFEACNYLAKLAGEEVPPPLKVRSPNPPRKKKNK